MPPRRTRRQLDDGSSGVVPDGPSQPDGQTDETKVPPRHVFHVVERPYFHPLGLRAGDKVVCTGGWQKDRTGGQRLEFHAHVWNLSVGKQYLRCWWPKGTQWVHVGIDQVRAV